MEVLVYGEFLVWVQVEVQLVVLVLVQVLVEVELLVQEEIEVLVLVLVLVQDSEQEVYLGGEFIFVFSLFVEEGYFIFDIVVFFSEFDSSGNFMNEVEVVGFLVGFQVLMFCEWCDLGVGVLFIRFCRKFCWYSFQNFYWFSFNLELLEINWQFVGQINFLYKGLLLWFIVFMEKYIVFYKQGWVWLMFKFMRRNKILDYWGQYVFGVLFFIYVQCMGQLLLQSIQ